MTTTTISVNNLSMELLNSTSMVKIFNFELFKVKPQDKDDVKQDAIVRIMKALKTQEIAEEKLPSFCQTIIKRTVVDYYRKTNRMIDQASTSVFFCDGFEEDGAEDSSSFAMESNDYGYDISDIRVDFELNRSKFTPTEQGVMEYLLYNNDGMAMNMAEIASELQINKSHTTRAFKKLRGIYES